MRIIIAIIGIGNSANSLIQGIEYYNNKDAKDSIGLMHWDIGGYKPIDIDIVAAFDMDKRKVGKDVLEAIFAPIYSTTIFYKNIHIGPSDYVPWQKNKKVCFIRMEKNFLVTCL